jgi:hypothetical protein
VVELAAAYWRFVKRHYVKDGNATSEQDAIAAALRPRKALDGHTPAAEFGPLGLKTVRDRIVGQDRANATFYDSRLLLKVRYLGAQTERRSPCRAGGGLLGGKDPAGRFFSCDQSSFRIVPMPLSMTVVCS